MVVWNFARGRISLVFLCRDGSAGDVGAGECNFGLLLGVYLVKSELVVIHEHAEATLAAILLFVRFGDLAKVWFWGVVFSEGEMCGWMVAQAKLGDANKFYYDEKLKKWVEEGVDPTPDVAPPPPPPTTSSFVGSIPAFQEEGSAPPQAGSSKPGTPPLAPSSSNYYSNRRQAGGVRSRYVLR
jgi:hypothetical protein